MAARDFDADVSGQYEVEVFDLNGDVLARYLEYRDAIDPHNRVRPWGVSVQFQIDTGGVSYSPNAETVREWRQPVIAVAYKIGGLNGVFPEPASIVGYVAAERLGPNPERPMFLCPMGLTKTPVGHGCRYKTPLRANKDRLSCRKDGTVRALPGVYWASNLATRLFEAFQNKFRRATIVSRFSTKNSGVPNPVLVRLSKTFPGKVFIGYGQYTVRAPKDPEQREALENLVSSWFGGKIQSPEIVYLEISSSDGNPLDTMVRLEHLKNTISHLDEGTKVVHRSPGSQMDHSYTLTFEDIERVKRIELSAVPHPLNPDVPFPREFPRSPLWVDATDMKVGIGDRAVSYLGTCIGKELFSSADVSDNTGQLFVLVSDGSIPV